MSDKTTATPAATEEAPTQEETPATATHDFTPVATLTEDEVKVLDEVQEKEVANDRTLRVALGHHSMVKKGLQADMTDWWKAMGKNHGFDPSEENFVLVRGREEGQLPVIARASDVEHLQPAPPQG